MAKDNKKTPQSTKKGQEAQPVMVDFDPNAPIRLTVEAIQQTGNKTTPRIFRKQGLPINRITCALWLFVCADNNDNNTLIFSQSLVPSPAPTLTFIQQLQLTDFNDVPLKLQGKKSEETKGAGKRVGSKSF